MKKLLGILVLGLLWCNIGLTADISYNKPLKRIYILGEQLEKNDHFSVKKYANEGGESIFISSPGGYGWVEIGALVRKKKLPVFIILDSTHNLKKRFSKEDTLNSLIFTNDAYSKKKLIDLVFFQ